MRTFYSHGLPRPRCHRRGPSVVSLAAYEGGERERKHATIAAAWHRNWEWVIPICAFPLGMRRVIYTTNTIDSLHMRLTKIVKNRGHCRSELAATELLFLALRNITAYTTSGQQLSCRPS